MAEPPAKRARNGIAEGVQEAEQPECTEDEEVFYTPPTSPSGHSEHVVSTKIPCFEHVTEGVALSHPGESREQMPRKTTEKAELVKEFDEERDRVDDDDEDDATGETDDGDLEVNDVYNKGDFSLISSDDVVFKIATYHLLSARYVINDSWALRPDHTDRTSFGLTGYTSDSSVFRDLIQGNAVVHPSFTRQAKIHLTDEELEDAYTLGPFLDFVTGGPPPEASEASVYVLENCFKLADKYDCPGIIRQIVYTLRSWLGLKDVDPSDVFRIAAWAGDVDSCSAALGHHRGRRVYSLNEQRGSKNKKQKEGDRPTSKEYFPGASMFSMGALSYQDFSALPGKYVWALCRAQIGYDDSSDSEDWDTIAEEFSKIMKGH